MYSKSLCVLLELDNPQQPLYEGRIVDSFHHEPAESALLFVASNREKIYVLCRVGRAFRVREQVQKQIEDI